MTETSLTTKDKKLLRLLSTRQGRRKSNLFVSEGLRCCVEAIRRRPDWVRFGVCAESFDRLSLEADPAFRLVQVTDEEFRSFAQTESPQGVLFVLERPDISVFPDSPSSCILVLDRLADPGNVGTILRTAWAVGMNTVVWTAGTCDPFGAKAVRSGMGAQFALELPRVDDLNELAGIWPEKTVWITDVRADVSCFDQGFDLRESLLVMGNEAGGAGLLDGACRVGIPMPGDAESLNVAQAAAVLLFEALRMGNI